MPIPMLENPGPILHCHSSRSSESLPFLAPRHNDLYANWPSSQRSCARVCATRTTYCDGEAPGDSAFCDDWDMPSSRVRTIRIDACTGFIRFA